VLAVRYIRDALLDVSLGLWRYDVWLLLGWSEIRQRYRRSTIGPFWLTLSMAVAVCGMGPLYRILFNQDNSSYIPYLSIGLVLWALISTVIIETSGGFIASEAYIKEFDLPLSLHIIRVVWRNLIILCHNIVVVLAVLLIYPQGIGWSLLFMPVAVFMIAINLIGLGLFLGVLCARFRDGPQLVSSFLQIGFFLTPVMWRPEMLGDKAWLLNLNPFYFFIESVRAPLLGKEVGQDVLMGVIASSFITTTLGMLVFGKYRYRIAYWL